MTAKTLTADHVFLACAVIRRRGAESGADPAHMQDGC